jgi:hypothetical protein
LKYAAFTGMNQSYYDHCGRTMLRSFKKHWAHTMPLYVYNEDDFPVKVSAVNCMGWNLGNEYVQFQSRHHNQKTKTFAKKGFAIIDAMHTLDHDRIMWLDADTVITGNIPLQLLDLIAPDTVLSTHFSVWHTQNNKTYHSCETGFFILNRRHPGYRDFCDIYTDIYHRDRCDDLRRFYDGEVYGKTVELVEQMGHKTLNLNPLQHKTPISRSVIAPYVTHYKAGLKDKINFAELDINNEV